LNSGPAPWATPPALFCDGFFQDRGSWTICLGWLRTVILLISASWVARVIGVSHWHPACDKHSELQEAQSVPMTLVSRKPGHLMVIEFTTLLLSFTSIVNKLIPANLG
jgi:hypothetical protein